MVYEIVQSETGFVELLLHCVNILELCKKALVKKTPSTQLYGGNNGSFGVGSVEEAD